MVKRALIAGFITLIVFLAGLSFGLLWDEMKKDRLREEIDRINVYSSALFIESQLLPDVRCEVMGPLITDAVKDVSEALDTYDAYTKSSRISIDRQRLLYRRYLLANIRYWMFVNRYEKSCGLNSSIVLFFFDEDCKDCLVMADRLTYLKKKYGEKVLVFPLNMYLAKDDPVAHTLKIMYNVTDYPTVIIDGKRYGMMSRDELEGLVCRKISC